MEKKKVLVIEDNPYKLETARRYLERNGITDFAHIDNQSQAMGVISGWHPEQSLQELDLIILDLMFYHYNDCKRAYREILADAGCNFLIELARMYQHMGKDETPDKKVDIIIYSSEDDWQANLQNFFIPSEEEFERRLRRREHPLFLTSLHSIKSEYEELISERKQLIDSIDFVRGHAHNEYELCVLLNEWATENK